MIKVYEYRPLIQSILKRYGIPIEYFELTHDIRVWCRERGIEERNSARAAKCFADAKTCHIVMREEQTAAMIRSAKDSMMLDGFEVEVSKLTTNESYLSHLLLHEIACFVLQTTEQKTRDEWAFSELLKNA